MTVKRYEFKYRSTMTRVLKKHFKANLFSEEHEHIFVDGEVFERGVTYAYDYDEKGEVTKTKMTDYLVDIIWTIDEVPEYSQEVQPLTPNYTFAGIDEGIS